MTNKTHEERITEVLQGLDAAAECDCAYFRNHTVMVPSRKEVITIIKNIQSIMFPDYFKVEGNIHKERADILDEIFIRMKRQITSAYSFSNTGISVD